MAWSEGWTSLIQVRLGRALSIFCAGALALLLSPLLIGGNLPARAYTTADGLPVNAINNILADRDGFLWFASNQGLTRFDGYDFYTFDTRDGLPTRVITALLQDASGTYWLGTSGGLIRFDGRRFVLYSLPPKTDVTTLFADRRGRIWCGSNRGLYVLDSRTRSGASLARVPIEPTPGGDPQITAIAEDYGSAIWVAFISKLYRLSDGSYSADSVTSYASKARISSLLVDGKGRLWMGTWNGLCRLTSSRNRAPLIDRIWSRKDGLASYIIENLYRTRDGKLWALTEHGLSAWEESDDKPAFHSYLDTEGWLAGELWAAAEDSKGGLWITTETRGVIRLPRNGITRYGVPDGLISDKVRDVWEDRAGTLLVAARIDTPDRKLGMKYRSQVLHKFNGEGFRAIVPNYPEQLTKPGWGERQLVLQDSARQWWITSESGLFRFAAGNVDNLAHARLLAHYSAQDGLASDDVFRLMEDICGNVWIGAMRGGVSRWDKTTGQISMVWAGSTSASSFRSDRAGNVWFGFWGQPGIARYRREALEVFKQRDGLAPGWVTDILLDHAGRLWITSTHGLSRIDNPDAPNPVMLDLSSSSGLASATLRCITEGKRHIFYVGSETGIYVLDANGDLLGHYGMKDGLPSDSILSAYNDSKGTLWFGTHAGLVRLEPVSLASGRTPLRILELQIGRRPQISFICGKTETSNLRLNMGESLAIRYANIAFGNALNSFFQYRLDGGELGWTLPSAARSINLAGLASGKYRLLVRAVNAENQVVSNPVSISFTVLPHFWATWWFESLIAVCIAGIVLIIHCYRVAKLIAVHKIRQQISLDLHDDIGSGLSQIAIWSEVARREGDDGTLEQIAAASRSLVNNISDIIWTVNPQRDSFRDLVQRIRYCATEMCSSRDIGLSFETGGNFDREARSDLRRHVYLIAKEAVHNAVRHSGCRNVVVRLALLHHYLELSVEDDGSGLIVAGEGGNGISNIKSRVTTLNGHIDWRPGAISGTRVHLIIPIGRKRA